MAKYLTRQRKRLLEYLSEHTDEQMSARQIADALAADEISVSAVYRNLSALEEEGLLKRSVCCRPCIFAPILGKSNCFLSGGLIFNEKVYRYFACRCYVRHIYCRLRKHRCRD